MKSNADGSKSTKLKDSSPLMSLKIPSKDLSAGCHLPTSVKLKEPRNSGRLTKQKYPIHYKKQDILWH